MWRKRVTQRKQLVQDGFNRWDGFGRNKFRSRGGHIRRIHKRGVRWRAKNRWEWVACECGEGRKRHIPEVFRKLGSLYFRDNVYNAPASLQHFSEFLQNGAFLRTVDHGDHVVMSVYSDRDSVLDRFRRSVNRQRITIQCYAQTKLLCSTTLLSNKFTPIHTAVLIILGSPFSNFSMAW
jgi:hypothetical protein